jgi:hypothetical protein
MTDMELNINIKAGIRLLLALVATTLLSGIANAQASDRSEAIGAILDTGFIDGHYLKEIGPMGGEMHRWASKRRNRTHNIHNM